MLTALIVLGVGLVLTTPRIQVALCDGMAMVGDLRRERRYVRELALDHEYDLWESKQQAPADPWSDAPIASVVEPVQVMPEIHAEHVGATEDWSPKDAIDEVTNPGGEWSPVEETTGADQVTQVHSMFPETDAAQKRLEAVCLAQNVALIGDDPMLLDQIWRSVAETGMFDATELWALLDAEDAAREPVPA